MSGKALRVSLLVLVLTALLWGGVVVWWQETSRLVTPQDVALYLIALPLGVIGGFFLLRAGVRLATRPAAAAEAAAAAPGETSPAPAEDPAERAYALAVLVEAVHSAGGTAEELIAALKQGKLKPGSDAELKDEAGFPVRTGRVQALDPAQVEAWYDGYAAKLPAQSLVAPQLRDGLLRALALLEAPLAACVEALAPLVPETSDAGARTVPEGEAAALPRLKLALLLPDRWDEGARAAAQAFVAGRTADLAWPADRLALALPAAGVGILDVLEQFRLGANRAAVPELLLLAACASAVTEAEVDRLAAAGRLYRSDNPQGLVPGEAAAALLLCAPRHAPQGLEALAWVHKAYRGKREKSADDGGRVQPDLLCALSTQALAAAGIEAGAVAAVVCDSDHRSTRAAEAAGMMARLTPELDAVADRLASGDGLGDVGAAALPLLLALAAQRAAGEDQPTLAVTVSDARDCAALVVRPPAKEDVAQPS